MKKIKSVLKKAGVLFEDVVIGIIGRLFVKGLRGLNK